MADPTVALGALVLALFVLCAVILFLVRSYANSERAWRSERAELLNRVAAANPREFTILQRASQEKDDTPKRIEHEEPLIGTY